MGTCYITKIRPCNIQRFYFAQNIDCGYMLHYENTPMQYTEIVSAVKIENFTTKKNIFNIFAQNIDCGYTLEPPCRVPTIYVLEQ